MESLSTSLKFFLNLSIVQVIAGRRMDAQLASHGLSLNDFTILCQLGAAPDEKLRRVDLAEKIGLTPSGVTRILSPLEKLGLVRREANSRDARVSYVKLAPAGKRILNDSMATAEAAAEQILSGTKSKKVDEILKVLLELGGTVA
ncbi:MarR family winged helix-turn-helix transcriptional regulator [Dyadobacter psychrotolerans]|uniref:MarR family transcriptional regulator n=1 Tax=Dyadobacter psychrotolerans TaxID=2541721 RepID=A0A4V2Z4Q8_9BACT|nr:MarR family transcriptional regulator [Dyadobacter psychrotolerans]TDE17618.1 MarR family transcriptional regulator [Dyadobacter psychrotolerans]